MATLSSILIICPQFMGALLPEALATFLHKKEVTVWMMSCGALVSSPDSYTQLAAEVEWQVTSLLLPGEAERTYSFSDWMITTLVSPTWQDTSHRSWETSLGAMKVLDNPPELE